MSGSLNFNDNTFIYSDNLMDSSFSWFVLTSLGASVNKSEAEAVLGNRIVSRKFVLPANNMTSRSSPRATPPCGGAPNSNASSKNPN